MRITEIRAAGLRHGTPEGGWANEIRPDDCVHTLIAVFTDEGVTGWGSAFTNDELVRGALHLLEPLYRGENPLEPERVSEKLHANTFRQRITEVETQVHESQPLLVFDNHDNIRSWERYGDGVHNVAIDSRGNLVTTEVYEGKRVQKWKVTSGAPVR